MSQDRSRLLAFDFSQFGEGELLDGLQSRPNLCVPAMPTDASWKMAQGTLCVLAMPADASWKMARGTLVGLLVPAGTPALLSFTAPSLGQGQAPAVDAPTLTAHAH